jgi:hypothetical protein
MWVVILQEIFVFHEDWDWTRPTDGVEALSEVNFNWDFGNSYRITHNIWIFAYLAPFVLRFHVFLVIFSPSS